MPVEAKDVVLIIADISGYTRFMVANQTELAHGHEIIAALLESIIAEAENPLSVAKIEGDAVFFYLVKDADPSSLRSVEEKLSRLCAAFSSKRSELAPKLTCECGACANVTSLRLKVIAHSGQALVYSIAGRTELAGVDVIIVHRLLKNSIASSEYLLLTEAAEAGLALGLPVMQTAIEEIDEIGALRVTAYRPVAVGGTEARLT